MKSSENFMVKSVLNEEMGKVLRMIRSVHLHWIIVYRTLSSIWIQIEQITEPMAVVQCK